MTLQHPTPNTLKSAHVLSFRKSVLLVLVSVILFSINGFGQGNTACTAVAVVPGNYTANGPSTGGGAINSCSFTGNGNATNADWYKYTPTASGTITISSCSGGANTRLSVYKGFCYFNPVSGMSQFGVTSCVASNDDACAFSLFDFLGRASKVQNVAVTAGTTYYIQWDDRWSTAGFSWSIAFTPTPVNSNPCGAIALACGKTLSGTTYGATVSGLTPTCTDGSLRDVYYTFNAFALSGYTLIVQGADDYDPVIAVYSGNCDGTLNELYCINANITNGTSETLTLYSTEDQVLYVRTYDYFSGGDGGDFTIKLLCPSHPRDECANAHPITVNGAVLNGYNDTATPSPGPSGMCGDLTKQCGCMV